MPSPSTKGRGNYHPPYGRWVWPLWNAKRDLLQGAYLCSCSGSVPFACFVLKAVRASRKT